MTSHQQRAVSVTGIAVLALAATGFFVHWNCWSDRSPTELKAAREHDRLVAPPRQSQQVANHVPTGRLPSVSALPTDFRYEVVRRQLERAQARYPAHYWESENIFGDYAGPNVRFLSAASLERFISRLAALPEGTSTGPTTMLAIANDVLLPEELVQFRLWNAPESVGLRTQLVGFDATELEFTALLEWTISAERADLQTRDAILRTRLGAERFEEFQYQRRPEVQTAMRDAQRLDLTVTAADWLATYRRRIVNEIDRVWHDPTLVADARATQVAQIQADARAEIADQLGLFDSNHPEVELLP